MGSCCRGSPKRQGTESGARIGRAVLEGAGGDTPQYACTLHSPAERAPGAGSWLWTLTRRCIGGRSREIDAGQEGARRKQVCITGPKTRLWPDRLSLQVRRRELAGPQPKAWLQRVGR